MTTIHLDTLDHDELAPYAHLTEAQLRNRLEPQKGIFIAESLKVIRIALQQGLQPLSFLCEEKHIPQVDTLALTYPSVQEVPVYTAPRQVLASLTGFELSRGVLCAMRRPVLPSADAICRGRRRIAIMDNVVNSTNTGAIFRAATALGVEALLLTSTCSDPLNRRSVRVSMGTVFQMPWTYISDDYHQWPHPSIDQLHEMGFSTVALALSDNAVAIDDPRLLQSDRIAIIMGTEGDGLSHDVIGACRHVAKIPMQQGVDSLNVAAAAAVAFWQLRQRQ